MTRVCSDCPAPIGPTSKGRCRSCAARMLSRDPVIVARRNAAAAERRNDPTYHERHVKACREAKLRTMADPAVVERMREAGRRVGRHNFHAVSTPEAREAARIAIKRRALAWCPEEHWDLNRQLKWKGLKLAERKQAILEMVPGTVEHARRSIANVQLAQLMRAEREKAQAY